VQAVILVGGEGTRLRPLTLSTPKQMLPIMGVPMLEGVLAHLRRHGVDEAVLSLGYLPDRFIQAYPDGECAGVSLRYAVEPEPLDTAGAVRFAAEELGISDTFVVVNGDVLTDLDVAGLVAFHRARGAEGTIALHPVDDPSRFGVVPTDDDGRVVAFVEKPPADEAPTNEINAGTYVFEPSVLARIPLLERVSIERTTFPAMVADGVLFAKSDDGYWLDTGTPAAYLRAHEDLLEGRRDLLLARGRMDGTSYLLPGATLATGATVQRSVLGDDVAIGEDAVVDASVILAGAVIGAGANVHGSIVGAGAVIGDGARLEPTSVVGNGVAVDAGTVVPGERVPAS
jgi:mannose-1-phosphate guanylyltransferase